MSFEDWDCGELLLNVSVKDMSGEDFLPYCKVMHTELFGFKLVANPIKDRAVMKWFKKTYGEDAGLVLKWFFYKRNGRDGALTFTYNMFQTGHKWWIDQIYSEFKQANTVVVRKASPSQFMSIKDLLHASA